MKSSTVVLTFPKIDERLGAAHAPGVLLARRAGFLTAVARRLGPLRRQGAPDWPTLVDLKGTRLGAGTIPAAVAPRLGSIVVPAWSPPDAVRALLERLGVVVWGEETFEMVDESSDELPSTTWHLESTNVRSAGCAPDGVLVGLLDSTMPEAAKAWFGIDCGDYSVFCGKGSGQAVWHSAATAALVVDPEVGAAPGARVLLAAIADAAAPGRVRGEPGDVIKGLKWLLGERRGLRRVSVINASIDMGKGAADGFALALAEAAKLGDLPILVASSGNRAAKDDPLAAVPALLEGVIGVGAIGRTGAIPDFSGWSPGPPRKPDLVAPGYGVYTIDAQGKRGARDGTSFSAPIVAGLVARLVAAGMSRADILRRLTADFVVDLPDETRDGNGRLQIP